MCTEELERPPPGDLGRLGVVDLGPVVVEEGVGRCPGSGGRSRPPRRRAAGARCPRRAPAGAKSSCSAKCPSTAALTADRSQLQALAGEAVVADRRPSTSGLREARNRASPPPTQKPTTPTPWPVVSGMASRASTAAAMSLAACSSCISMTSLPASSGSVVSLPRYRSGATATNPWAANRSATSRMWGTSPHHSWMTTTPGPLARGRQGDVGGNRVAVDGDLGHRAGHEAALLVVPVLGTR